MKGLDLSHDSQPRVLVNGFKSRSLIQNKHRKSLSSSQSTMVLFDKFCTS